MQEDFYMMWFQRLEGVSRKRKENLLSYFENPKEIWNASETALIKAEGVSSIISNKIIQSRNEKKLDEWICELKDKNIRYISWNHPEYPHLLKKISDPPFGLYIKGNLPDQNIDKVALVGARRCTEYGKYHAEYFGKELAQRNIVVVSGMARGIDSMAHQGAVSVSGPTIAVLGCGLDICYPPENRLLYENIIQCGAAVSEFAPNVPPFPMNFPLRNRIIAGMCKITAVLEAKTRSGSLITAEMALENGREVFMLPGNIDSPLSQGTNEFIKKCNASLLTGIGDILSALGIKYPDEKEEVYIEKTKVLLETDEKKVYDCISLVPINMEELMQKYTGNAKSLQYILFMLEMKGYVKRLPGQRYVRSNQL